MGLSLETARYWVVAMHDDTEYTLSEGAGQAMAVAFCEDEALFWVGRTLAGGDVVIGRDSLAHAHLSTPESRASQQEIDKLLEDAEEGREPWQG